MYVLVIQLCPTLQLHGLKGQRIDLSENRVSSFLLPIPSSFLPL